MTYVAERRGELAAKRRTSASTFVIAVPTTIADAPAAKASRAGSGVPMPPSQTTNGWRRAAAATRSSAGRSRPRVSAPYSRRASSRRCRRLRRWPRPDRPAPSNPPSRAPRPRAPRAPRSATVLPSARGSQRSRRRRRSRRPRATTAATSAAVEVIYGSNPAWRRLMMPTIGTSTAARTAARQASPSMRTRDRAVDDRAACEQRDRCGFAEQRALFGLNAYDEPTAQAFEQRLAHRHPRRRASASAPAAGSSAGGIRLPCGNAVCSASPKR